MKRLPRAFPVLLLCIGVPGIAHLIDVATSTFQATVGVAAARMIVLCISSVSLLRWCGGWCSPKKATLIQDDSAVCGVLTLGLALTASLGRDSSPAATLALFTAITAITEEYIFRRRLPDVLRKLLSPTVPRRIGWPLSVLVAQAVFAISHFVVAGHPSPLGPGFPIARLFAAGCLLAAVYLYVGIVGAVALHFALNLLIETGAAGTVDVRSTSTIPIWLAVATVCIMFAIHHRNYGLGIGCASVAKE